MDEREVMEQRALNPKSYAELTGDMKLAFDDIALGFREKLPQLDYMTDEQFCEGVGQLVAVGLAKITVFSGDEGFDAHLKLSDKFYG